MIIWLAAMAFLYACCRCRFFSYAAVVDIGLFLVMCYVMVYVIVDRISENADVKLASIVSTIACW